MLGRGRPPRARPGRRAPAASMSAAAVGAARAGRVPSAKPTTPTAARRSRGAGEQRLEVGTRSRRSLLLSRPAYLQTYWRRRHCGAAARLGPSAACLQLARRPRAASRARSAGRHARLRRRRRHRRVRRPGRRRLMVCSNITRTGQVSSAATEGSLTEDAHVGVWRARGSVRAARLAVKQFSAPEPCARARSARPLPVTRSPGDAVTPRAPRWSRLGGAQVKTTNRGWETRRCRSAGCPSLGYG